MSKDYAKRVFTTTRTRKKKPRRIGLFILPIVLILSIIGGWAYYNKSYFTGTDRSFLSSVKGLMIHKHYAVNKPASLPKIKEQTDQEPKVHFDFYNELPNIQVTVPETADNATPPKPVINKSQVTPATAEASQEPAQPTTKYILKVGQYTDSATASQERLSLLLSGFEAEVVKINSEQGEVYQVQHGSFTSMSSAKKMQKKLEAKGIACEIKKIG